MQQHLYFDETKYDRIIAISDIHGGDILFERLLEKVALQPSDLLVLMGDYVNRGRHSLAALRKVMQLAKLPNCVVLMGNHETFVSYFIKREKYRARLIDFLENWHYPTILHEMVEQLKAKGVTLASDGDGLALQLRRAYAAEFDFIDALAILLEGKSHIFVHAGYEDHYQLPTDYESYLKYDDYASITRRQNKTVVVGHWPVSNVLSDYLTNAPYYYADKNIYFIDGGLNIKHSGELNALIIRVQDSAYRYDYQQVNDFEQLKVTASFDYPTEKQICINYPDYEVDLIEAGPLISRCRYCKTGALLSVFNCLLKEHDGRLYLSIDYVNDFLNVPVGSVVSVAKRFADCTLVKYGDRFYWAANCQLEKNDEHR